MNNLLFLKEMKEKLENYLKEQNINVKTEQTKITVYELYFTAQGNPTLEKIECKFKNNKIYWGHKDFGYKKINIMNFYNPQKAYKLPCGYLFLELQDFNNFIKENEINVYMCIGAL